MLDATGKDPKERRRNLVEVWLGRSTWSLGGALRGALEEPCLEGLEGASELASRARMKWEGHCT